AVVTRLKGAPWLARVTAQGASYPGVLISLPGLILTSSQVAVSRPSTLDVLARATPPFWSSEGRLVGVDPLHEVALVQLVRPPHRALEEVFFADSASVCRTCPQSSRPLPAAFQDWVIVLGSPDSSRADAPPAFAAKIHASADDESFVLDVPSGR